MPPIFKALASITVWILFIGGCIALASNVIMGIIAGEYYNPAKVPEAEMFLGLGVAIASLILAVCAMKLRQMLE